jgi:25S rRNA (uracil2634-N3)-methyltransferase
MEDGIMVGWMDTLDDGAPVMDTNRRVEASMLGVPVIAEAAGGEKEPLEDGIALCQMDTLGDGAPVIATNQKDEVSVQGDPVAEGVQAIALKGNGKEEKDAKGIKLLKHYSSTQSILFIGDGDFSFSLALATAFGSGENLVATSLDSYGMISFPLIYCYL